MSRTTKIILVLLAVIVQLLVWRYTQPDELRPREDVTKRQMVTGRGQHSLTLVSSQPWLVDRRVLGTIVAYVYDDVKTLRPADYWELYDTNGDLLAVSWFDEFGIRRSAIDRGILEQEDKLEGIFVVVVAVESI